MRNVLLHTGAIFLMAVCYSCSPKKTSTLERVKDRENITSQDLKRYHVTINPEVVLRMKSEIEEPVNEPVVILDGTKPYEEEVRKIIDYLNPYSQ